MLSLRLPTRVCECARHVKRGAGRKRCIRRDVGHRPLPKRAVRLPLPLADALAHPTLPYPAHSFDDDEEAKEHTRRLEERFRYDDDEGLAIGSEGAEEHDRKLIDEHQPRYGRVG